MDADRLCVALRAHFPETAFHVTTSCQGAILDQGVAMPAVAGLSVFAVVDPGGAYGTGVGSFAARSPEDAADEALEQALMRAGRVGGSPAALWVNACPGLEERVVARLRETCGPDVPIVGGSAADDTIRGGWWVADGVQHGSQRVAVSALFPSVAVSTSFEHAYERTGVYGVVTASRGRYLLEVDGEGAAAWYNRATSGAIEAALGGGTVLAAAAFHPLGVACEHGKGVEHVRPVHPERVVGRGLTLFAEVAQGSRVEVMRGSASSLVNHANSAAAAGIAGLPGRRCSGALVAYCAGCMLSVPGEQSALLRRFREGFGDATWLCQFTFGEQGAYVGVSPCHGNLMIATLAFGAAQP